MGVASCIDSIKHCSSPCTFLRSPAAVYKPRMRHPPNRGVPLTDIEYIGSDSFCHATSSSICGDLHLSVYCSRTGFLSTSPPSFAHGGK